MAHALHLAPVNYQNVTRKHKQLSILVDILLFEKGNAIKISFSICVDYLVNVNLSINIIKFPGIITDSKPI